MKCVIDQWPDNGLESVKKCPCCNSLDRDLLYDGLTDIVFCCAPGKWTLHTCSHCQSVYLDPRPSRDTIHLAYQTYYTHTSVTKRPTGTLSTLQKLKRSLANGYRNYRFGTSYTPANKLGIILALIIPKIGNALRREFKYLPYSIEKGRLLDVGFGNGRFLELASDAGWDVYGVDTDMVAVNAAKKKGFSVRLGEIAAFGSHANYFDVITLNHVIEHIHNARDTFKLIFEILKPGGTLILSTPNIYSFGHLAYKEYWRGIEVPRHLVIFNWNSIANILKESGFDRLTKIKDRAVTSHIFATSRALRRGNDPYSRLEVTLSNKLLSFIANFLTIFTHTYTEFITLQTFKPYQD